jgi:hypothetical protein
MRLGDYEQRAKRRLHNGRCGFHDPEPRLSLSAPIRRQFRGLRHRPLTAIWFIVDVTEAIPLGFVMGRVVLLGGQ